jgi:hypothetical protein
MMLQLIAELNDDESLYQLVTVCFFEQAWPSSKHVSMQ